MEQDDGWIDRMGGMLRRETCVSFGSLAWNDFSSLNLASSFFSLNWTLASTIGVLLAFNHYLKAFYAALASDYLLGTVVFALGLTPFLNLAFSSSKAYSRSVECMFFTYLKK